MENTENVINENSESSKVKKPYKRPQNRNYNKRPKMTATNNENTNLDENQQKVASIDNSSEKTTKISQKKTRNDKNSQPKTIKTKKVNNMEVK